MIKIVIERDRTAEEAGITEPRIFRFYEDGARCGAITLAAGEALNLTRAFKRVPEFTVVDLTEDLPAQEKTEPV